MYSKTNCWCFCTFVLLFETQLIQCYRILIIPMQGKSHMIAANAIGQELKKNGHEVYTLAGDNYQGKSNQIGAAGLDILYYRVPEGAFHADSDEMNKLMKESIISQMPSMSALSTLLLGACQNMMDDKILIAKLSSLKFDLAIVEGMPFLPCAYLLPHILKIPHATFLPGFLPLAIPGYAGLPSFSPFLPFTPTTMPMKFTDRLLTTLLYIALNTKMTPWLVDITGFLPKATDYSLMEKYRKQGLVSDKITSWIDFFDDTELIIMTNSDLTFDYPKPLYPNVISIEGLSVNEADPLPKDMEDLLQSSEHGVVVVSFGSAISDLPDEVFIKMVGVFGKRKELFLMRYSGPLKDMPKNVKVMSWLPQNDLLAHEKVKLFITHGGLNGLHEAVYQGVPMLCIPLMNDQFGNAKKLEAKGFGSYLHLFDYTEKEALEKMNRIISDPMYKQNVQKASRIMRHRPMNARQTAAFWIEHVLQFGGDHLKPSSVHLTWWQYYCLDTLGTIGLILVLVLWLIYAVLKFVFKKIGQIIFSSKREKRE